MISKDNLLIGHDAIIKFLKVSQDQFDSMRRNKTHNGLPLKQLGSFTVADKDELAEWFEDKKVFYHKAERQAPPLKIDKPNIFTQGAIVKYLGVSLTTVQRYSMRNDRFRLPMETTTIKGKSGNTSVSNKKLLDQWKKLYDEKLGTRRDW